MAAIALWGLKIEPGKKFSYTVENDLRITNAALGPELADQNGRSTLRFTEISQPDSDDSDAEPDHQEFILCSLTPGKIEQQTLDIVLAEESTIEFSIVGKNTIYLSGNFIDQGHNAPPFGESDSDEEDAFALDEVSSDVAIDPAELDEDLEDESRFEEVVEEEAPVAGTKRRRDSDAMSEDRPETDKSETDKPLSKSQRKKLNKKLKADDGKAIPSGSEEAEKPTSKAPKSESKGKPESKQPTESKEGKEGKKESKPVSEAKEGKKKKDGDAKPKSGTGKKELDGGLVIEDKTTGTGKTAKKGKKVSMRYIGKLQDGTVFDQNVKGSPFSFTLGTGEVIKGWDQGVVGMQIGGERILTVPPALAYGKKGAKPTIPPNSTLTFEVKLLEVK